MVSKTQWKFTNESEGNHLKKMKMLGEIIDKVSDTKIDYDGRQALADMRRDLDFIGELNSMKVLPLSALVGTFDISTCFVDALHGEIPEGKPHGKELANLKCNTRHLQWKFIEGLNEYHGVPREYFFHGDHVLCMAQGLHHNPSKRQWDVFFLDMPLYRFVEDPHERTIRVQMKSFGSKEWEIVNPNEWLINN